MITWSCEITWQTKTTISTLRVPMATKLGRMVAYLDGLLSIKSHNLWSHGFVRSRDKLKSFYLQYYSVYGHQTWQAGNLPRWDTAHNVTWLFHHVVLWDHVTTWKHISTITVPMATNLGKLVTYPEGLLPIILLHPLFTWSCEITLQTKSIIFTLPQYLWPQNLAGWWLTLSAFYL